MFMSYRLHVPPTRGIASVVAAVGLAVALMFGAVTPADAATAAITLSPTSGPSGTSVTVSGTGFKASTTGSVTVGTTTASFTSTSTGTFKKAVTITSGAAGKVTVTAKAGNTTASALFTVTVPSVPPVSSAALRFGVANPGGPLATSELDSIARTAGESPSILLLYKDFTQSAPITDLNAVAARGATPLLTWEPWVAGGGVDQPAYALDRITAGDFDGYLQQWGRDLAAWGKPVMLRFAHEMNGNWYPWAEGVNGNSAGDYVAAWQHVVTVVKATGASNVNWVWSPNVPYTGSTDVAGLFPGAAYLDTAALDGYNWGTSQAWSNWQSPTQLFADGLGQMRSVAPGKPILIAETASSEVGGSKAAWNSDLVSSFAAQPDIMGFVWFNLNKEVDWRIESSTTSASAFAAALQSRRG